MRVVLQRTSGAKVAIDGSISGKIGLGMVVLLGIEEADETTDAD